MKAETKDSLKGFAKKLFMGVARAGLEIAANVVTAEAFMTIRRSVTIINISERRLEIESKGKREILRVTITKPACLSMVVEALESGGKLDLVLAGYATNRTGKTEVLTADIVKVSRAM
jgi:hypothetical protein